MVMVTPGGFEGFFRAIELGFPDTPAETVAIAAEFGFRFLPGPPDSLACETHGRKHLQSAAVRDLSVELSGIPRRDNHKRENLMRHWVAVVRRELGRKPPADG